MNGWIIVFEGKAWGPFAREDHAREWADKEIGKTGWLLSRLTTPLAFAVGRIK